MLLNYVRIVYSHKPVFWNNIFFTLATDLTEAKDKLSKEDSSSSEDEDEQSNKMKVDNADKPTEEVSLLYNKKQKILKLLYRCWKEWKRNWKQQITIKSVCF